MHLVVNNQIGFTAGPRDLRSTHFCTDPDSGVRCIPDDEKGASARGAIPLGVRAVAIVSPFYYKLSPEAVYAYFAEIAKNSPIDVTN